MHASVKHLVDSHEILSCRPAILRLHFPRRKSVSIINSYSTTLAADESELDAIYYTLKQVLLQFRGWEHRNAKLGKAKGDERRLGKFGLGEWNEIVLLGFCSLYSSSMGIL
ncbi:hypothetical protein Y032_0084g1787 [Ancylostoma ceylanicum]|uniref:Uncharacterized protein n=1 Tax=Ancylostoma ceylanicum TaxID=53326 RepID=A0A016TQW9_9BILA|nr:hypothetical protein Y032_0084g1787 [Ancylostoma ceylanicum]